MLKFAFKLLLALFLRLEYCSGYSFFFHFFFSLYQKRSPFIFAILYPQFYLFSLVIQFSNLFSSIQIHSFIDSFVRSSFLSFCHLQFTGGDFYISLRYSSCFFFRKVKSSLTYLLFYFPLDFHFISNNFQHICVFPFNFISIVLRHVSFLKYYFFPSFSLSLAYAFFLSFIT